VCSSDLTMHIYVRSVVLRVFVKSSFLTISVPKNVRPV
jgi:hypothetical protein